MALRLDQKTRILSALPLFGALEPAAVHVLAFSARERPLADGETLFSKGDPSDGGHVVVSGEILLDPGADVPAPRRVGPGALIGETALIAPTERPATATATEASSVLVLPRDLVLQVLEAHPDSAARLRALAAERLAGTRAAVLSLVG